MQKNNTEVRRSDDASDGDPLAGSSYVKFADQMRGSREIVLERLRVYSPLVDRLLRASTATPTALDVGSGRGEWLELLRDWGWQAQGVDSNSAMVEFCRGLGLNAVHADAFQHLSALGDNTVDLISAFHVVEHLTFVQLVAFVRQCLRLLKPAGILIMETPNPQNILVGCGEFYADPTHQRPLPSKLLKFTAQDAGFLHTRILHLNGEHAQEGKAAVPQLRDVFVGTGFDYAVVAQKGADAVQLTNSDITMLDGAMWPEDMSLERKLTVFDHSMQELHQTVMRLDASHNEFRREVEQSAAWRLLSALERQGRRLKRRLQGE